jgi:integrase
MPRKPEQRLGQIGRFWLSKKPGRSGEHDAWCRTWYDDRKRQTCRVSIGTTDFQEATSRLATWVVTNERTQNARAADVLIEAVLLNYWNDHAQNLASSKTERLNLSYWQEFWEGCTVADLTPQRQKEFRDYLASRGTGPSGIDRILSTGRSALNRASKNQEIDSVPFIFSVQTQDDRRSREPKGKPLTPSEMAAFLDAACSRHVLLFSLLAICTLARPGAILDCTSKQYDPEHKLLDLNPPGRRQNKKFRPVILATPTLRPWLDLKVHDGEHYVTYRRRPIHCILKAFRITRDAAGLPKGVTPYSFRHGMARELRKRDVPTEQISLLLGHLPKGSAATTAIYAPYSPLYMREAIQAIEDVLTEIGRHMKRTQINSPATLMQGAEDTFSGTANRKGIGEEKRAEVRGLILAGVPHAEVVRRSGVSSGTVSLIRQDLRKSYTLYRSEGVGACVPVACRLDKRSEQAGSQTLENIGGPGRIRTCDNTVMSGAVTPEVRMDARFFSVIGKRQNQ